MSAPASVPILSCADARAWEKKLLAGDEASEWAAMQRAGRAVGAAVLQDFQEIGGFPPAGRALVLAGKGHNAGDAFLAAKFILEKHPTACVEVIFAFGERTLRPLAQRAWRELTHAAPKRIRTTRKPAAAYDLCLDGVFGFQFRPPLAAAPAELLRRINGHPRIRLRAAVDLPSGLGETGTTNDAVFRADFTYTTGIVKTPVIDPAHVRHVGRPRYLDLGFFATACSEDSPDQAGQDVAAEAKAKDCVLIPQILAPLAGLRRPQTDKRTYGHLFVLSGSRSYPGAVLMTVLGALHSGVGLVTAFVPESLAAAYAARAPEAIWVGWPETPDGGMALEGLHLLREHIKRATALVIGPGLGREAESLELVNEAVKNSTVPLLLDADALQPDIVRSGAAPRVLTPHAGEFARIAAGAELPDFCRLANAVVLLKGAVTRICGPDGGTVYHSFGGGPVLARGGSGDVLSGLTGGLLAQTPAEPLLAACRGAVWHGLAADALARSRGQVSVQVTQLLDFLPEVLREAGA